MFARLSVALLLLLGSASAMAGPRVVNGNLTSEFPSTGALLFQQGSTPGLSCSGTMIGCETFLTAAHCVCDTHGLDCLAGGADNPSDLRVFLQHAGIFEISSVIVHPQYDPVDPVADIAVLKLMTPVTGIAPTPINTTGAPSFGSSGTIAGYGISGGNNADGGLKREGDVVTASCESQPGLTISNFIDVCWNFSNPVGPPGADSNTCSGDSGGPLFIDGTVAGVTSGGTAEDCLPLDHSYDTSVYFYRDWVREQAGSDLDSAACGSIPQAGETNAPIFGTSGTLDVGNPEGRDSFTVPSGTTLVRVTLNAGDADSTNFDLYVKEGSPPTTSDADCASIGGGVFEACEFINPGAGTWHVLANRVSGSTTFQITATTFENCSDGANNGESCDDHNPCTDSDVCQGGTCSGSNATDGTACDDGNECTSESCQSGVCSAVAVADDTPCDDGSLCTRGDTCQGGVCTSGAGPLAGCTVPFEPSKGVLVLKDRFRSKADVLVWRWVKGSATPDFGNPTADSEYVVCIYDEQGDTPELVLEQAIPSGGNWTTTKKGFKYLDNDLAHGGIQKIVLKTGDDGKAKIIVKGKSGNLDMTSLPLHQNSTVTAQLIKVDDDACWQAEYDGSIKNQSNVFKAKAN